MRLPGLWALIAKFPRQKRLSESLHWPAVEPTQRLAQCKEPSTRHMRPQAGRRVDKAFPSVDRRQRARPRRVHCHTVHHNYIELGLISEYELSESVRTPYRSVLSNAPTRHLYEIYKSKGHRLTLNTPCV